MSRKTELEKCEEACELVVPNGAIEIKTLTKFEDERGGYHAILWSQDGREQEALCWGATKTEAIKSLRVSALSMQVMNTAKRVG